MNTVAKSKNGKAVANTAAQSIDATIDNAEHLFSSLMADYEVEVVRIATDKEVDIIELLNSDDASDRQIAASIKEETYNSVVFPKVTRKLAEFAISLLHDAYGNEYVPDNVKRNGFRQSGDEGTQYIMVNNTGGFGREK
ncbi:MAG: hypothetical protein HW421_555 [Ignavibacteria bacterium]|nr:hypothetical protein [Ignavibacteria bacterium]